MVRLLVREDRHSPYIRFQSDIYRPLPASLSFAKAGCDAVVQTWKGPVMLGDEWAWVTGETSVVPGTKVAVKGISGSPYARIGDGPFELWTTHGSAIIIPDPWVDGVSKVTQRDSELALYAGQRFEP